MVRVTETTGVYTWLAIRAGQLARGRSLAVVVALAGTTALLSAFLDNLTTVLLVVPITFLLADALDIDPIPLVIIEIIASNVGGTATLIGDPPNIIIAGATDLSFMAFITNLAPIAGVTFAVVTRQLYLFFRSRLRVSDEARDRVMDLDAALHRGRGRVAAHGPDPRRDDPGVLLPQAAGARAATVALAGAT